MDAETIIRTLIRSRWRRNFCLPHYTPALWWECDLFELTKAGFFREYEVKVTRKDFKEDAKKWRVMNSLWPKQVAETKRARLASGVTWGPTFFWYVTPVGLLQPSELPSWAGLIEIAEANHRQWYSEKEAVKAPRLHRATCDERVEAHARSICYWRMHELLRASKS